MSPADLVLRPYDAGDFEATVTMWREVSVATYTFLKLHTFEEDRAYFRDTIVPGNKLTVAERAGRIVGYLAQQGSMIDRLYVAVAAQGTGVGTALLRHARKASPTFLRLFTHQKNHGARAFYEARGFQVHKLGVSPPPESEPDVEYHWRPS